MGAGCRLGPAALESDASPTRQRLGLAATALQRTGREDAALAVLERQLAGAEGDPDAWRRAAGLAQRMGDPERAAALWETAWRRGVLSGADDLMQRIRLHLAAGTPARAAEILERALSAGNLEDSLENRRLLAEAWQAARDRDQALTAWREVAEQGAAAEDWLRLGQLAAEWDRLELAREALRRARQGGAAERATGWRRCPKKKCLTVPRATMERAQRATVDDAAPRARTRLTPHWLGTAQLRSSSVHTGA